MNTSQQRAALDALHALLVKHGTQQATGKVLRVGQGTVSDLVTRRRPFSARMLVRLGVTVPLVCPVEAK